MKKLALIVLIAAVAATPALAAKKRHKKKMAAVAEQTDLNANGKKLVRDAIPSLLPTPLKMIYFYHNDKK